MIPFPLADHPARLTTQREHLLTGLGIRPKDQRGRNKLTSEKLFYAKIDLDGHVIKKNNRPIWKSQKGRLFPGKTKRLSDAESFLVSELSRLGRAAGVDLPLACHMQVVFRFYFAREKFYTKSGSINKTIGDLSNLIQLPEDALQKSGIIENDTLIHSYDGSRKLPSDHTWLEIEIFKFYS